MFYDPHQVATNATTSFSPSAGKPALAVASWQQLGIPLDIRKFEPLTRNQIKLAHDPAFVDALLDCGISNGFGNRSRAVAASLPYTTGSMLAAAQEALRNGIGAISPTSGFHHAGYGHAAGFCSLNGIAIAAQNLPGVRVGLLDLDQHEPDGVREIKERLGLDLPILHGRGTPRTAERWLQLLPAMIIENFIDCNLLLVQLGADPHIDDELGRGWLDDDQLRRRDRAVFKTCRAIGLPVCWCLAGGYRRDADGTIRPVLDVHDASLQECAEAWL